MSSLSLHIVIKESVEKLNPKNKVLEVGFGLASSQIIQYSPASYTIIESDPKIAKEAKAFAQQYPNVTVIEEDWKTALPKLEYFDAIFFNDYSAKGVVSDEDSIELVSQAEAIIAHVQKTIPHLTTILYADEDLEMFCDSIAKEKPTELARFILELKENGQITKEQFAGLIEKYNLGVEDSQVKAPTVKSTDCLFPFARECLEKHLVKGGRLAAFCRNSTSKYENSLFFENIITNFHYDYTEDKVFVDEDQRNYLKVLIEKSV